MGAKCWPGRRKLSASVSDFLGRKKLEDVLLESSLSFSFTNESNAKEVVPAHDLEYHHQTIIVAVVKQCVSHLLMCAVCVA